MDTLEKSATGQPNSIGEWNSVFEFEFNRIKQDGQLVGKVVSANRKFYQVLLEGKQYAALLSGKLRHRLWLLNEQAPVVGDWVVLSLKNGQVVIQGILTRSNYFSRQRAGAEIGEQVVAANLDYLLITMGLDQDFNLNRLDRYLLMAQSGGVKPLVLLSKADLCPDYQKHVARTRYERELGLQVIAVSVLTGVGIDQLSDVLTPGVSALLVGSSGAGKSSLINLFMGSTLAATNSLSAGNGRGRCTTNVTQAYQLPNGAWLIDAAGMREIQLWAQQADLLETFEDISRLASSCKFRNCQHRGEPGCQIKEALLREQLTLQRFHSFMKLKNEMELSQEQMRENKRKRFKAIAIAQRQKKRMKYGS